MTEKPVEGNELDTNWSNEYCHQEYIKFLLHMESSLEHNDTMLSKHPDIDEGKTLFLNLTRNSVVLVLGCPTDELGHGPS